MRVFARAIGALALALAVGACSSSVKVACPTSIIMPELKAVAKFGPGPGRQDSDAIYGAGLQAADSSCSEDKKKGGVAVSTKLALKAVRLKPDVRVGQLTYFVAVINRRQTILNKRDFVVDLDFGRNQVLQITEELEEFIPLAKNATGADYGIVIGFELTPDELQYIREHAPRVQG
jgi:hypothetical protein